MSDTVVKIIDEKITRLTFDVQTHLTLVLIVSGNQDREVYVEVNVVGENGDATIVGIVYGQGNASIVFYTMQHHKARLTTSNLLVKAVLTETSSLSYEGGIMVDKAAQKTNAYQRNENLLLDIGATAVSKPALEILANDVRCTHGATIGTLREDEMWYLAARGIDKYTARKMIANGFLMSALSHLEEIDKIRIEEKINSYG